jgi:hypothetical protein
MSGDYEVDARAFWTGATAVAAIASMAAVVTQLVLQLIFDTTLTEGSGAELSYWKTFGVAFAATLVGMGVLHLFLAGVPRGKTLWQLLASLVLIASLIPITQLDSAGDNKLFLLFLHLVTYLFAVPTMVGMIPRVAKPIQR